MSVDPFPSELVEAAAKALAMDESSLVFTDGYGGFDFDHGGAASTVLSVVGPLIQQARDADGQRLITHGRHCTCTPCAREDWTNPALAPCGMHGRGCPQEYAPLGAAGDPVPAADLIEKGDTDA